MGVGVVEGAGKGADKAKGLVHRHRPAEPIFQRAPGDQLGYEIGEALVFAEVVYLEDIGMVEPCDGLGFLGKPVRKGRVIGESGGQHLDGNVPVQRRVVGLEHGSHAAASQFLDNLVPPQTASWQQ